MIFFFRLSRIPSIYSDYLDKMVKLLLSSNHEFRPSVEMIIHHPTVICNYDKNATPFMSASRSQIDEFSHHSLNHKSPEKRKKTFVEDRIDNIIDKIEKLSQKTHQLSLESDPRAITEDVYNRKLMSRLKLLREKESVLKAKEDSLKTKEYLLKTRESSLIQKQKLIEKREREMEVATVRRTSEKSKSEHIRQPSTSRMEPIKYKRESRKCIDLDSTTCSADPGDTSIYPTAVKLDPSKIIKPSFFKHHLKSLSHTHAVDSKVTYDVNGSGDCTRTAKTDIERQPLSFVHNHTHYLSTKVSRSKLSAKKNQNYFYTK